MEEKDLTIRRLVEMLKEDLSKPCNHDLILKVAGCRVAWHEEGKCLIVL